MFFIENLQYVQRSAVGYKLGNRASDYRPNKTSDIFPNSHQISMSISIDFSMAPWLGVSEFNQRLPLFVS